MIKLPPATPIAFRSHMRTVAGVYSNRRVLAPRAHYKPRGLLARVMGALTGIGARKAF